MKIETFKFNWSRKRNKMSQLSDDNNVVLREMAGAHLFN